MVRLPKISVVTPSYQQADTLEDTILSVTSQEYPNLEYIVIDGGSTDGSVEILERYSDSITFWVSEPDDGQTAAISRGFDMASGEILCWLNSDDSFAEGALKYIGTYFAQNPDVDFVYGDAELTDKAGAHLSWKLETSFSWFVWLWWYNYLPQPSTFWRSDLYRGVDGLDQSVSLAMDGDLWERMGSVSPPVHVPRVLSRIRIYPEQRNQAHRAASDLEDHRIRERHLGRAIGRMEWRAKHLLAGMLRVTMRVWERQNRVG